MHSIIGESFTELISEDVPHRAGITSLVKYILKQQIRAVLKICKLQNLSIIGDISMQAI